MPNSFGCGLWMASYTAEDKVLIPTPAWQHWDFWQFSDNGKRQPGGPSVPVPGIPSGASVDTNFFLTNLTSLQEQFCFE